MHGKSILLIISGGIAAYKSLDFIRLARKSGAKVRAVLTKSATEFVTPLSVSTLCEAKVHTELFDLKDETEIGHIRLSREADIIVVAPATANILARMAHGLADDLATSVLLAANKPVLVAPAMNCKMWENPATERNIAQLRADGIHIVGPNEGDMACNEWGMGRMAEPAEILASAQHLLRETQDRSLEGKHIVVTAGPTHEPIDPIRYIANRSSGKQGFAIAAAAASMGARVTLITGPVSLPTPPGVSVVPIRTAREMLVAVEAALPADAAIFAAAVADWRSDATQGKKIKKTSKNRPPALTLIENPDVLATIAKRTRDRPSLVVGFAAETESVLTHAKQKLTAKGCDWIVANDVTAEKGVMGGNNNQVHLVTAKGVEAWPWMHKETVAEALMRRIAEHFSGAAPSKLRAAE
ncbi:MAG: bifunctional phosphopantothenoylcysteine decarboxylase/phosphopantothenate--cysteine ligase CoaBC [Alphaproteobacteria bacterium]